MPKGKQNNRKSGRLISQFFRESQQIFSQQYANTGLPSVLLAQNMLETFVQQGTIEVQTAIGILHDSSAFSEFLST
jgi:hypothetical protein